jgi:hypothetical protein
MIEIIKVTKENGELKATRKHPYTVETLEEMELERKKLQAFYGTKIYFTYRVKS